LIYQSGSHFFGLGSKYKQVVHDEIFSLCHYSNGFTFNDVYNMPVHWRRYYMKKLVDIKEKESAAYKSSSSPPKTIQRQL